jgi:LEA14-like dessication related protein
MRTMTSRRGAAVFLGILGLLLMGGCASFSPSLEAPRITLINMTPLPSEGMESAFELELRLINPNDVPLDLKGIDCRLEINDSTIASGVSNQAAELPALGTLVYPVTVYASASDFIILMVRLMADGHRSPEDFELTYRLAGRVFLADAIPGLNRLNFASEGDLLKLIEPPQP